MEPVTLYTKVYCPYCIFAKGLLRRKGIAYEEIDLEKQPHRKAEMVRRAHGAHTVPQVFVGNRHIGGSDDLKALCETGELDTILEDALVPA